MMKVANLSLYTTILLLIGNIKYGKSHIDEFPALYNQLSDHKTVSDDNIFPYVAAILKTSNFLCMGTLINDVWVLSEADALYPSREYPRLIRIRFGSVTYKEGGVLSPIKYIEIHPKFDEASPEFDLAMVRLPQSITFTHTINPIRLKTSENEAMATHFLVTSWNTEPYHLLVEGRRNTNKESSRRILQVDHLHPTEPENCSDFLESLEVNKASTLICLDPGTGSDPCWRPGGAPVVLNRVLWGVVSSWLPEDCWSEWGPVLVSAVAARETNSWLQALMVIGLREDDKSSEEDSSKENYDK